MEFLSVCCDAMPIGELDRDNEFGFCSKCMDNASFYSEATICGECGAIWVDDRVIAGMKCGPCAYG